jgi:hypothetical protein
MSVSEPRAVVRENLQVEPALVSALIAAAISLARAFRMSVGRLLAHPR